jgi:two-component system response regulator PhoP
MHVLIVEDEAAIRNQVADRLREEGFAVEIAEDGREGLYFMREYALDLAIVDLGLPGMDGIEMIRQARSAGCQYPVLILTARTRWQEKVEGLEAGADDYLAKPFHVEELLARVRALIRRSAGLSQAEIICGPVRLNTSSQEVRVNDQLLDLTAYEYRLLHYLMLNAGKVSSKSELTEHIYEEDQDRDSNVIEVFIGRLRKKLDPDNTIKPIDTLRGRGYRFNLLQRS